jgi:HD-like signal output (HDOD) protein
VLARLTPGLDPDRAMLAGLIHNIGAVAIINEAKHHHELVDNPKALYTAIQHLAPEIGGIIMRHWNFGADLAGVVSNASDWLRDDTPKPDYLDLVLVARLHAFVGTPRIRSLPRIDLIPAFHKLALGKLTPQLSVGILDKAENDITSVEQLLNA